MSGTLLFCRYKRQLFFLLTLGFAIFSYGQTDNAIVVENRLAGNPASEWDISGAGSSSLQGFGTEISVNKGERINFKINTSSVFTYTIKIYRLGYYQGNGARLIANLGTFNGTVQPSPITNTSTGLVDCGNWSVSAYWDVPSTAVSGVYIAKLARTSSASTSSHIVFIVRDDASRSDLFFQTSDATWQAYNNYGGNSLYVGATNYSQGRAAKVSYNRPFMTRNGGGGGGAMMDWLFNAEYPMIRFIERNGYDVTYTTNVDAARRGSLIRNHRIFISNGHDEYWSGEQRSNVEAARDNGVNLAFFSGNEVYWKTRWENSVDGSNTPYRTLVCYKEGTLGEYVCGTKCDPNSAWTGLWRDGCSYPSAGGCKPENALTGTISWTESTGAIKVTSEYKNLPFWRNTSVANLGNGQSVTLTSGMIGYEWDPESSQYQSSYPANRTILASTTLNGLTHKLSLYTHPSGALVFGAGTCQWAWGLDDKHDRGSAAASIVAQQATVNLFGDMGALPGSLMSGLVSPVTTPDNTAPTSVISSPVHGATLSLNAAVTIAGTASDAGGGVVSKIEISLNSGSWQTVSGTTSWSYSWTPASAGAVNIRVRGTDSKGNIEVPGATGTGNNITVNVTSVADNTAPSSVITSPLNGASVTAGNAVTITGTASDVGGVVSAVEISVNGGTSWQTASGTTSWSYTWTPVAAGSVNIRTRAKDNSNNTETTGAPGSSNNITVSVTSMPATYTIFQPSVTPQIPRENDGQALELGMKFRTTINGYILGIRYYKGAGTTGTHSGSLWTSTGTKLATANFASETTSGWQQVLFTTPVAINANTTYVASYFSSSGDYCSSNPYFTSAVVNGPVKALANGEDGPNGLYRYTTSSAFPNNNYQSSNYFVDVVFATTLTPASSAPIVTTHPVPQSMCDGANVTFTSATSGEPAPTVQWQVNAGSAWSNISGATSATLTFAVTTADNSKQYRAVWTNSEGSVNSNAVTLTVNPIPAAPIVAVADNCGSSVLTATEYTGTLLWSNNATTASITVQAAGTFTVKQTVSGCVSPTGSGTAAPKAVPVTPTVSVVNNCGSSVLTAAGYTGELLWSTGETTASITVTTGGTYTVTQTVNGCASNAGSGIAAPKVIPGAPLVIVSDNCGSSALIAGNYTGTLLWSTGATTPSITVTAEGEYTVTQMVNGCTGLAGTGTANPKIITATAPTVTVVNNCGNAVLTAGDYTGSLLWSTGATTPSITVAVAGTYTVTQTIGECPGHPGSGIAAPLGTSVTPPAVSVVNNCGNSVLTAADYTGSLLWSTGETTPSIIVTEPGSYTVIQLVGECSSTPGTGVAAPADPATSKPVVTVSGNTSFCQGGSVTLTSSLATGNLWSNGATTASIIVSTTGSYFVTNNNAGSCPEVSDLVAVTVNPTPAGTISSPSGTVCQGEQASVVFNATSGTAPYSVVINGTTYSNVANGSAIVTGNSGVNGTTASLWDNTAVPAIPLENDGQPLEVGMKFRTTVAGFIKSIRFYKGSNNDAGVYTLKLYLNSSRALLASVDFSNRTATGWQTIDLPSPVAVTAGTTYLVSYYSASGNYANSLNYFASARTNGPLTGLANNTDGTNGVYRYGAGGGFPTSSYRSTNYWVDVVFSTSTDITLNLTSVTDANGCSVSGSLGSVTLQVVSCPSLMTRSIAPKEEEVVTDRPLKAELDQNSPNPFKASTLVRFGIPAAGKVRLTLFDLNGRVVQVLLDEVRDAGYHTIPVYLRDQQAGVYYYKLETGGESLIKKMTLVN